MSSSGHEFKAQSVSKVGKDVQGQGTLGGCGQIQGPGDNQESQPRPVAHSRPKRVRPGPLNRCRAARACQKCNEKRVKCDASERSTPCTRCVDKGEVDCKLIQSRRGTHARKLAETRHQEPERNTNTSHEEDMYHIARNRGGTRAAEAEVDPATAQTSVTDGSEWQQQQAASSTTDRTPVHRSEAPKPVECSSLDERMLSHEGSLSIEPEVSPGDTEETDASTYQEISWSTLFSHLLEDRKRGQEAVDKGSITYVGEAFPLALILKDVVGSGDWRQLHHRGPSYPGKDDEQSHENPQRLHPPHMRSEDISYLSCKGAFETPDQRAVDALIDVFVNRVYPLYPIVNRHEFREKHRNKKIPWILLHAICLAAATFCPAQLIYQAGFTSRRAARWSFYSKAKTLFDFGYEGNKVVALQVSILMTFWGGGPNTYWNFYSWINTGVTIAETLGCQRTMVGANIQPQDRSLLKRLWWVLVIRDTACAALVGRPFRINMDHCDVDQLVIDDFEQDMANTAKLYQIEASKLSLILRDIIMVRFSPRQDLSLVPMSLHYQLTEWRSKLPQELAWSDAPTHPPNVLSSCLAVSYNNHLIITHLNCSINPTQSGQPPSEEVVSVAAQQIARISCGVVTRREILTAPHEFLQGAFTAAVVFYKQTKSPDPTTAQLGMAGLTNCQMVLHETSESWDPSPWVQHIFNKISGNQDCGSSSYGEPKQNQAQATGVSSSASIFDGCDPLVLDDQWIPPQAFDPWQNYPVLGDLFDLAPSSASGPGHPDPEFDTNPGHMPWT